MMSPAAAPSVWKAILAQGAVPMGSNAWNKLRVIQGTEFFRLFAQFYAYIL